MYPYNRTVSRVLLALYLKLFIFNFPDWIANFWPQTRGDCGYRRSALLAA